MPRPTERVTIEANHHPEYSGFNGCLYSVPYDRVQVHEFSVEGADAIDVGVERIQLGSAGNATNMLQRPVALYYLNNTLAWFDWTQFSLRSDALHLVLDKPRKLMIELTREVPTDFTMRAVDDAYVQWKRDNPGATDAEYLHFTAKRIAGGEIKCACNDCYEKCLPQDYYCANHRRMKDS